MFDCDNSISFNTNRRDVRSLAGYHPDEIPPTLSPVDNNVSKVVEPDEVSSLLTREQTATLYLCQSPLWTMTLTPQWGAADVEIKVPSSENTEFKRSPF